MISHVRVSFSKDWMGNAVKSVTVWASRQNDLLMPWLIVAYTLCTTLADHPDTQSIVGYKLRVVAQGAKPRSRLRLCGKCPIVDNIFHLDVHYVCYIMFVQFSFYKFPLLLYLPAILLCVNLYLYLCIIVCKCVSVFIYFQHTQTQACMCILTFACMWVHTHAHTHTHTYTHTTCW